MSVMTQPKAEHPKIAPLDTAKIREEETRAVTDTLALIPDPMARLEKAVAIIKDAEATEARLDRVVKQYALSLALREGVRGVFNAIPMTRSGFYQLTEKVLGDPVPYEKVSRTGKTTTKIKYVWPERPVSWDETVAQRAADKGVRLDRSAAKNLPAAAAELYAAQVRIEAAIAVRDELVPVVATTAESKAAVARLIGRHPSRVSHLVKAAQQ
jgi:hypothetical protein